MQMAADVVSSFLDSGGSSLLSVIVSLAGIAGILWKGISYMMQQQDKRAAVVKKDVEMRAELLRKENDEKARVIQGAIDTRAIELKTTLDKKNEELRIGIEVRADELRKTLEKRAEDLRYQVEKNDKEFKEAYEKESTDVKDKITKLDDILKDMFQELKERADLTNGNVASIRNDISDLQEDVQDLYNNTDPNRESNDALSSSRNKDLRRREKRKQIERQGEAQAHEVSQYKGKSKY